MLLVIIGPFPIEEIATVDFTKSDISSNKWRLDRYRKGLGSWLTNHLLT